MTKHDILSEINLIRSIMGLINESEEMTSQASDLSKIQNFLKLEGVNVDVKDYLDKTNPICAVPKTGDSEKDNIIKKIWDWASDTKNNSELKNTFQKIKDYLNEIKKFNTKEQVSEPFVIGSTTISSSLIDEVGIILLIILITKLTPKKTKCDSQKSINDLI